MTECAMLAIGLAMGIIIHAVWSGSTVGYGKWLGQRCWVRPLSRERWKEHVIVAVSWRGGVCVRDCDCPEQDGYWIRKENVPSRLRFDRPKGAE